MSAPSIAWLSSFNATAGFATIALSSAAGTAYGGIPAGGTSDVVDIYVVNDLACYLTGVAATAGPAYDCKIAVYDSTSQQLATEEPVEDAWIEVRQLGYGGQDWTAGWGPTPPVTGYTDLGTPLPGSGEDDWYELGGSSRKVPIVVRQTLDSYAQDDIASLVGDTLPAGNGFHLRFRIKVPAAPATSAVSVGIWLEFNYLP